MIPIRLGFALTILVCGAGTAQSAPIYVPQAEVIDRLAAAFATRDPARLGEAFRAMGDYGKPAAAIVESSINAAGYRHLEKREIEAAIAVFRQNARTFPESANAWDSLGEAIMTGDNHELAIRYYRRSLELDPDNRNAARMIERMNGELKLSRSSGNSG